ncbi:MAG: DUF4159 domain-containing protein [Paracoccaceae bacterium]
MTTIAGIGFTAPWLLLALLTLPILWLILRAVPPAPVRRLFPGVVLLLGLKDDETITDRTPWWLMLIRMLAVAAVILGLAGPVLNPQQSVEGRGPLLFVFDASWAGASRWDDTLAYADLRVTEAGRAGRPVAILRLTSPESPVFQAADVQQGTIAGLAPEAWSVSDVLAEQSIAALAEAGGNFDTIWMGDALNYPGRETILDALQGYGDVTVVQSGLPVYGLMPPVIEDGKVRLTAHRSDGGGERLMTLLAQGRDPGGVARVLSTAELQFTAGETAASVDLDLPSELRARITRFELQGQRSAGAIALADDSLRRREVALIAGRVDREGLELLSPLHYLEQALAPTADLLTGALMEVLPANPDVVVLADVANLSAAEEDALAGWVSEGGLLLRFAGPRVAASEMGRDAEHRLMPVRLRAGGRTVGGAMSWGEPKSLAPFDEDSPFFGLSVPGEVRVTAQVMAQPDPTLADRVIAALNDGTPLVTRKPLDQGQIVLFHVTANAEWSSLPLSGLFVEMLERLAVSSATKRPDASDLEGTTWTPEQVLNGFGALQEAGTLPGVDGPDLAEAPLGPDLQPGVYAGDDRRLARNVVEGPEFPEAAVWPSDVPVEGLSITEETDLGGLLLSLAILMLAADVVASLALAGRLWPTSAVASILLAFAVLGQPTPGHAQAEAEAITRASELSLAHVLTGDRNVDDIAHAGLQGLSDTLFFRTSVEPANPTGVDLEMDELAFFPLLYWPITEGQPIPSSNAYAKLNAYLRSGGMIVFDTRDADIAGFGSASPNGRKLQQLAAPLDIPPLEPVPEDHVLTRTFYLLQDFPGRHRGREIWVEAAPPDAERIEGMPFRNLNDGVTPIVIGGNDWAAAWATTPDGVALLPVGRGFSGERQRELAYRFGVNLVMHVLTGNYKSDQVHVPALLDRLGQ